MIDARRVERGRPPLDAVDSVAEAEQILDEISAVLAGDAGNQRYTTFRILRIQRKFLFLPMSIYTPHNPRNSVAYASNGIGVPVALADRFGRCALVT
jgi:hypothetical protein